MNFAEVLDQLARVDRVEMREVDEALSGLIGGPVAVATADEPMAWRVATIRARCYDRKTRDLSLTDCFLLASAGADDVLATADGDVATGARAEGIEVRRLPSRRDR